MNSYQSIAKGLLVTVLALSTMPAESVAAPDADSDFMYATGLFRKQRWQYAADAFGEFLKEYPEHPRTGLARLYLGLSLNSLEQYAPARVQFETFVKDNADSRNVADARYRIGECSYYLKEFDKSISQFTEYLELHKGHKLNPWASLMLGESYNAVKNWPKAESVLQSLMQSQPSASIQPDTLFALAVCRQGQQKFGEAIKLYGQVIDQKSAALSHRAYARIGTIHYSQNEFAKASATWDQIVSDFSDKPIAASAALQSGVAQFQLKQYEEAIKRFDRIPASSPVTVQAGMWKGICLRELGQLDTARKELALAFNNAAGTATAAEILFNRGQIEVLDGKKDAAAQMFLDLADRWPGSNRAFDSLFNSTQLKMETGDIATARRLMDRLNKDFAEQSQSPRVDLLSGRLLLNEGKTEEAVSTLQGVAELTGATPQEQLMRNYHLIRALHKAGKYPQVMAVFGPLQDRFAAPEASEFSGAIALAALSSLEQKEYAKARMLADRFLSAEKRPDRIPDALAARAVAAAFMKELDVAEQDLAVLVKDYGENSQTWIAVIQVAEAAWQHQSYAVAARTFNLATNYKTDRKIHLAALSGAAWSEYRQQNFESAISHFRRVYSEYPASGAALESRYMEATCLVDNQNPDAAAPLFLEVFEALDKQPEAAAKSGSYYLDSGRMYARIQGQAGEVDAADTMWKRIAERFDKSEKLDEILDEWAYLNLQNNRFSQSDRIYGELLDRFPDGKFAGQARLSLAESQMQANRLDVALREFTSIATNEKYDAPEREAALYHAIDIHAAQREWPKVIQFAQMFADDFSGSDLAANVQLLYAEALLDQRRLPEAEDKLSSLKAAVLEGSLKDEPWTERIWVALSEVALAEKRYEDVDKLTEELTTRTPDSRFMFQIWDVQGRRWKTQAEPDFKQARAWFDKVIADDVARGTETAARCQFQIAESYLLEANYKEALREYYRVYLNYAYDEWRAIGLYQAAGCEVKLKEIEAAKRSYSDLMREFPNSDYAAKARKQLQALEAGNS